MKNIRIGKCSKGLACTLAVALLAGTLGGCGKAEGENGGQSGTESGSGAAPQKGRYVETEEALPEELKGQDVKQMFTEDNKLHFLTMEQEGGKAMLREWEQQEEGLVDVTQDWLSSLTFDCGGWNCSLYWEKVTGSISMQDMWRKVRRSIRGICGKGKGLYPRK